MPLWRQEAEAGYPGLSWEKIPLYSTRQLDEIWTAMKMELYWTSIFNLEAKPRQDAELWDRLEKRFALKLRRMSEWEYLKRLREQLVLEWTREGKTLDEMAAMLRKRGLHPLRELPGQTDGGVGSARRVVVRIKRRLREHGLIERKSAGRPPKKSE